MIESLLPCPSCPWRLDQTADAIPRYSHSKACGLMNTVGEGDGMRPIMACHGSSEEEPRACIGYLAREGFNSINVRILAMKNRIPNPFDVQRAVDEAGIELHADYPAVLAKLEANLRTP